MLLRQFSVARRTRNSPLGVETTALTMLYLAPSSRVIATGWLYDLWNDLWEARMSLIDRRRVPLSSLFPQFTLSFGCIRLILVDLTQGIAAGFVTLPIDHISQELR